jgi:hypothetical protein
MPMFLAVGVIAEGVFLFFLVLCIGAGDILLDFALEDELEIQQSTALIKLNRLTVASMARRGGVTDLLSLPLVRVRERRPAARFLTWYQTAMPERDQSHFHINISKMD